MAETTGVVTSHGYNADVEEDPRPEENLRSTLERLLAASDVAGAKQTFLGFVPGKLQWKEGGLPLILAGDGALSTDIEWFTPLLREEVDGLNAALAANPITVRKDRDEFVLDVCTLEFDKLMKYELATVDATKHRSPQPGSKQEDKKAPRGPAELSERSRRVLLDGLPDNYRRAVPAPLAGAWAAQAPGGDAMVAIEEEEARLIQRDVMRTMREEFDWRMAPLLTTSNPVVRRQRLSFYEMDLLELRSGDDRDSHSAWVLWRPGTARRLTGDSAVIHNLNTALAVERPLLRSADEARQYTRFFTRHVWGDEGPFHVVESRHDDRIQALDLSDAGWDEERHASLDAALDELRAMSARDLSDAETGRVFAVRASVLYGDVIFNVEFHVQSDGMIEMVDDDPLLQFSTPLDGLDDELKKRVWLSRKKREYRPFTPTDGVGFRPAVLPEAAELEDDTVADLTVIGRFRPKRISGRSFHRCRFRGLVDLSALVGDGALTFEDCVFEGGLSLANASVGGTLRIERCTVLGRNTKDDCLTLERLRVGTVTLSELAAQPSLNARSIQVNGAFVLAQSCANSFNLSSAGAHSIWIRESVAAHGVEVRNALVKQYVAIQHVKAGNSGTAIDLYGTVVEHNYILLGPLDVVGDVNARFVRAGTVLAIETDDAPNKISGTLDLSGASIRSSLRIRKTDVGGDLVLRSVRAGSVRILGPNMQASDEAFPSGATEGASQIGGVVDLTYAKVDDEIIIANVTAGSPGASLVLRHATVGGDLRLFLDEGSALRERLKSSNPARFDRCQFGGGIDLDNAAIGGDVDLTAVECGADATISLKDARLSCDLILERLPNVPAATAGHLVMDGLECDGNASIVGLRLVHTPSSRARTANVDARFARFKRQLEVARATEAGLSAHDFAEIRRLDLTGTTVGELAVSVRSFEAERRELDPELLKTRGIILRQATVEKLTAFHAPYDPRDPFHAYPAPIDLSHAEVKWWEFYEGSREEDSDKVEHYKRLLEGDPFKQLHTYHSIEQNLVNRGHEEAADEIHWQLRVSRIRRHWRQGLSLARPRALAKTLRKSVKFVLWDLPTSHSSGPFHLLGFIGVWFIVSVFLLSMGTNVSPSGSGLTADRRLVVGQPGPEDWNWADGFWLAMRYHVPVAHFGAREEWGPASARTLAVWPAAHAEQQRRVARITPEDYANLTLGLHWFMWPIVIITASRKYLRRAH